MKPITTEGYWYDESEQYCANMSSIYTTLIQYAGRFCEDYASDLLYDIEAVNKVLKAQVEDETDTNFYFGIRAMGVDGFGYIRSHIEESKIEPDHYYRAMFVLHIHRDSRKLTAELKRVDGYEMKKYISNEKNT